jgi:hypothetical protein
MLKISSLCLYISNLGTFWLKIEQFWPFEEISIFSNGDHLGYKSSPLKLLSQSQLNFAEMILGWSPSKNVFGISDFRVLIEQMVSDKKIFMGISHRVLC